jgi:hypothetical protein
MVTRDEFAAANRRARQLESQVPKAVMAKYDRRNKRIVIELSSHLGIFFFPKDIEGLENAPPGQLDAIEISPSGYGLHFPNVDADVYLPSLLDGILGSKQWIAARLGKSGGKSKSVAKTLAARENGKRGGRPRQAEMATPKVKRNA